MSRISQATSEPDLARTPSPSRTSVSKDCTFDIPSSTSAKELYHYDLCPLLSNNRRKIQVVINENTPPTYTQHVYDIAMFDRGGLEWDATLPASLQCPKGTWICLTVTNTRPDHPSEPTRILQVIPISTMENINPAVKYISNTELQVAFHGGRYTGKRHKAVFQFHCNDTVEPSSPASLWNFNGTHTFSWASKHACPIILPISTTPSMPKPPSNPENEPSDAPPDGTEDTEPSPVVPHNENLSTMLVGVFLMWVYVPV